MKRFPAIAIAWMLLSWLPRELPAQTAPLDGAVEQGRTALEESADFPWYDRQKDSIQRMDVQPPRDIASRKSKWQPSNVTWSAPGWLATVLRILGWILLGLILVLLAYALARATVGVGWGKATAESMDDDSLHGDIDRIEALPFQLKSPQVDLMAQARRHFEAGEFAQAITYLYSYQLIQLDRHQLIRLTKGKTNRQYVRELRSRRELRDILSRSMVVFEEVFFGHHSLSRERFETCWRRMDEFHQHLVQAAA
jgi:hypothetical protein